MVTALSGWGGRWGRKNTCGCQDSELSNFLGWNVMEGKKELPRIYGHSVETVLSAFSENPAGGACVTFWEGVLQQDASVRVCQAARSRLGSFLARIANWLVSVTGHSLFSGIKH